VPDRRLDVWEKLADPEAVPLLEAAAIAVSDGITPASVMGLRKSFPGSAVTEAIELASARARAGVKFADSNTLMLDRAGLEQATSETVAEWKAARFGDAPVLDLCCGIGGDAMALARRGPCTVVDRDPVRAWMAGLNAGAVVRTEAVEVTDIDHPLVHLDPARRDESSGRRSWRLEDLVPDLDSIRGILARVEGGAVKLGPGLPRPTPELHVRQSLSIIAEHGRLVQAVVWTGRLAGNAPCEAVDLPSGRTLSGSPGGFTTAGELDGALLTFHPSIERLELGPTALQAAMGGDAAMAGEPAVGLGLVTLPSEAIDSVSSDWFRAVRILEVLPPRSDAVASALRSRFGDEIGDVVVRTRAAAIDVDAWSRDFRRIPRNTKGPMVEVLGLRLGRKTVAIIAEPIELQPSSTP
jgi:hypothetical protein